MFQNTQNAAAATEQSRLREKARLVRVWYNIDRRFGLVLVMLVNLYVMSISTSSSMCVWLAALVASGL